MRVDAEPLPVPEPLVCEAVTVTGPSGRLDTFIGPMLQVPPGRHEVGGADSVPTVTVTG